MMRTQFFVRMKGDLARHLSEFLDQVGLERLGRLDDDWDQEFGRAKLQSQGEGLVELTLWRGFADHEWKVKLTYEQDPLPEVEAERLRLKVLDAAAEAGMTVTAQSATDPSKPGRAEGLSN